MPPLVHWPRIPRVETPTLSVAFAELEVTSLTETQYVVADMGETFTVAEVPSSVPVHVCPVYQWYA